MKILGYYLRNEIRTGGHRRYLELLSSLAKNGWDVTVFLGDSIDHSEFSFKTIPLKPVKKGLLPFSVKQVIKIIPNLFKLEKGEWGTIAFGETNFHTMRAAKIILEAKVVFAFRSNSLKAKKDELTLYNKRASLWQKIEILKMKIVEKKICRLSDRLIFQTEFDRDNIRKRCNFPLNKAVIIPNSIRESWFKVEYKDVNKSKGLEKIIYLGSYDKRKGAKFLLEALNYLKSKKIEPEVDFYGYGREIEELKSLKTVYKLGKVRINERMSNPISHLWEYDLMVVPSIYDSYPNVILESIYTGTPVIASNNSGMKGILMYDDLLFKTGDIKDIANKIEKIYKSEEEYSNIKELCHKRREAHDFIWPSKFEEILNNIKKEN